MRGRARAGTADSAEYLTMRRAHSGRSSGVGRNAKRAERPVLASVLAERVGFEPTVRYNRTPDFESGAFDHSATFPLLTSLSPSWSLFGEAKIIEHGKRHSKNFLAARPSGPSGPSPSR